MRGAGDCYRDRRKAAAWLQAGMPGTRHVNSTTSRAAVELSLPEVQSGSFKRVRSAPCGATSTFTATKNMGTGRPTCVKTGQAQRFRTQARPSESWAIIYAGPSWVGVNHSCWLHWHSKHVPRAYIHSDQMTPESYLYNKEISPELILVVFVCVKFLQYMMRSMWRYGTFCIHGVHLSKGTGGGLAVVVHCPFVEAEGFVLFEFKQRHVWERLDYSGALCRFHDFWPLSPRRRRGIFKTCTILASPTCTPSCLSRFRVGGGSKQEPRKSWHLIINQRSEVENSLQGHAGLGLTFQQLIWIGYLSREEEE